MLQNSRKIFLFFVGNSPINIKLVLSFIEIFGTISKIKINSLIIKAGIVALQSTC